MKLLSKKWLRSSTVKPVCSQRGDTLIEVLLALTVFGFVIPLAFNIMFRSYGQGQIAQDRSVAQAMVQGQANILRSAYNDYVKKKLSGIDTSKEINLWDNAGSDKPSIMKYTKSTATGNSLESRFITKKDSSSYVSPVAKDANGCNADNVKGDNKAFFFRIENNIIKLEDKENATTSKDKENATTSKDKENATTSKDEENATVSPFIMQEDNIAMSTESRFINGLWIEAYKVQPTKPNSKGYYDFYIKACWVSQFTDDAQKQSYYTVVRLYDVD